MKALITGASSGIGKALAHRLAREGMTLIVTGRDGKALQELPGKRVIADLSTSEGRAHLIEVIKEELPDLLVNNAGFGTYGNAVEAPLEEQLKMVEVNASFPLEATLTFAKTCLAGGKRGTVMNISSISGFLPSPGMSVYAATKAFLTSVSKALDHELKSKGVRVLVSCPGQVESAFAERAAKQKLKVRQGPVMSAKYAADQIWKQIVSQKQCHIFNHKYRLLIWFAQHFFPESFLREKIYTSIKARTA